MFSRIGSIHQCFTVSICSVELRNMSTLKYQIRYIKVLFTHTLKISLEGEYVNAGGFLLIMISFQGHGDQGSSCLAVNVFSIERLRDSGIKCALFIL